METLNNSNQNGLLFNEIYIPEELLSVIFSFLDNKTLLICQIVCKYWHSFIQNFVGRKRAEQTLGIKISHDKKIPWIDCYFICKTFGKNLIKNHSGSEGPTKHWKSLNNLFACFPIGIPLLPNVPIFEGINSCFVPLSKFGGKFQTIDLAKEGISGYVMDTLQPVIKVSDWLNCRSDCEYRCIISLQADHSQLIRDYEFKKDFFEVKERNKWVEFSNIIEAYGPGLRRILFCHEVFGKRSRDSNHPDLKLAGTCIKLELSQ